jgi:class 3 adenylate cyclase
MRRRNADGDRIKPILRLVQRPMLIYRETERPEAAEGRMTAAIACRTCGTQPRVGARFCDGCGAAITQRDAQAEFKQVTVLFADVVHSMDLAATVGAERLREIMAELTDRCATVVRVTGHGGQVHRRRGYGGVRRASCIE